MNVALTLVFFGLLVFLSHLFSSIYTRKKIPDVLLLLGIGLLVGPVFHFAGASTFGVVGPVFVAITLLVILFESGTSLSMDVLRSAWKSTVTLSLAGFFVAMLLTASVAVFFGLDFLTALTLGAILGGTSSAVVIPLVKSLNLGEGTRTVLVLESAATDVLCIVFTLAFLQALKMGELNVGGVIGDILASFTLAAAIGFAGAVLWSRIITRMRKLQNSIFTTPAFVFIMYGISELLGYSGAITALAFGISMANIDTIKNPFLLKVMGGKGHKLNKTEQIFFGEIVFVLKTIFFVYIGLSMEFKDLTSLLAGLIITVVLFIGRILLTKFIRLPSASTFDRSIASMMIPKGLAAAVLAGIPLSMGIEGGEFIKNTTYAVVLFSITLVSIMILLVDKVPAVRRCYIYVLGNKNKANKDANEKENEEGSIFVEHKGEENDDNSESYVALNHSAVSVLEQYRTAKEQEEETTEDATISSRFEKED